MKKIKTISLVLSAVLMMSVVFPGLSALAATAEHHLLRPVDFAENLGTWTTNTADGAFESSALMGNTDWNHNTTPATATVTIENGGEYTVWVRGKEFSNATPAETPGAWTFKVKIDDTTLDTTFGGGDKSVTQFVWRNGGTITLSAGTHTISLLDPAANSWARFDSILLTTDSTLVPSENYETLLGQIADTGSDEEESGAVIIDNDAEGVVKGGPEANWVEHQDATAQGGGFLAGSGNGSDIVAFTWPVAVDTAGYWNVEVYVPDAPENIVISDAVAYQINCAGGVKNFTLDQTNASGWVKLGSAYFSGDGTETVKVTPPKGEANWALVDAVRLTYAGATDPEAPVIVVDNTDSANVLTGDFPNAGGIGWAGTSTYRAGYVGENYYSLRSGDENAAFTWMFTVTKSGYYEVSVNLPDGSSGGVSTGVSYELYGRDETKTAILSHAQAAGYYSLGRVYLEAGEESVAVVKLVNPGDTACMVDAAMIEYVGDELTTPEGNYQIDLSDPQQTILGLGVEIQSDSLGSGNTMDANDTSGHSVPHDLTEEERQRLYTEMLDGFRYVRLAGGLFYRGTDAEQKHLVERWDTQDEELAEMLEVSGIEGFNLEFWSPTPYFKSNGEYHGGTLKCFDSSWEYYGNEEKTTEFLNEFADTLIADFQRMADDGLPIVQFSLQNEPPLTSVYGTYSFCYYSEENYYKTCKVLLPRLKAAFPELIIHAPSWNGQHAGSSWLIKDDPDVLDCVDMWSWHTVGYNSDYMIDNSDTLNSATEGIPVINTEFEYQPGDYSGQYDYRFVNTTQAIMNWMVFENSPTWYWLHMLKPLGNEESLGYSLGMWRKSGDTTQYTFSSAEQTEYWNSVEEKTWAYNYPNYNALRGFLKFMPWDSVRYSVTEDEVRKDQRIMAWKTPEGKLVFALTNRDSDSSFIFNVDTGLENASFTGYALTAYAEDMVELESQTGTVTTSLDTYSVQFWVQDEVAEEPEQATGSYLILPNGFATQGTWTVVTDGVAYNETALSGLQTIIAGQASDAVATLENVTAGTYRIWIRSKQFPITTDRDTSWKFQAKVNGTALSATFGGGGKNLSGGTYVWEDGGTVTLNSGTNTISLVDPWCDYAKCDAVFITADLDMTPADYTVDALKEEATVVDNKVKNDTMDDFVITDDYAGGNIVVVKKLNDVVSLDNKVDPEEGSVPYFYWNFEVTSDTARTVTFSFDQNKNYQTTLIGANLKVVYSTDGGKTWNYIPALSTKSFSYTFEANETVRFGNVIPYVLSDYNDFVEANKDNPNVEFTTMREKAAELGITSDTVTFKSGEGRDIPLIVIGNQNARRSIVLTARHHSCETVASFTLEGMLSYLMDDVGAEFLSKYCIYAVPLVDIDGVENGEQGKGRGGQDHNRDYGVGTYPEITAITTFFPEIFKTQKLVAFFDSHNPGSVITDLGNHLSYGATDDGNPYGTQDLEIAMEAEINRYAAILDSIENADTSADKLTYDPKNAWRAYGTVTQARVWFQMQGAQFATTLETSYTDTPHEHYRDNTARWGKQLAEALKVYIDTYVVEEEIPVTVQFNDKTGNKLAEVEINSGDVLADSQIPTAPNAYGYTFIGWSYDITLPVVDSIVITALYEKTVDSAYVVTVPADTEIQIPAGQEKCYYNDRVKIIAPKEKDGKAFSYWTANGGIFSYSNEISFLTFGDAKMEAVYGAETENRFVVFTDSKPTVTKYASKFDMHVMGVVSANGGEVSEIGIVLAAGGYTAEEMTDGTATTVKLKATKATDGRQFVYTVKNIKSGQIRTAMVYAVIDGVTYYSDTVCIGYYSKDYTGDEIVDENLNDPFAE